jgi:hypothetical protein
MENAKIVFKIYQIASSVQDLFNAPNVILMLHKLAQTINVQYVIQLMDGLRTVQLNNVNAAVKILLTLKMDINANSARIYCRIAPSVHT